MKNNQTAEEMIQEMQQYEKGGNFMKAWEKAHDISSFYRDKGLFEKAIHFDINAAKYLDTIPITDLF